MARRPHGGAILPLLLLIPAVALTGCAGGSTPETAPSPPETPRAEPGVPPASATADPAAAPTAAIFTTGQSERGRLAFDDVCSACHTTNEFRGRSFQSNWGRRTVYSFFRTVRSTMPDDNPGGLEEARYLDIVAYILSINGHVAGAAELTADSPMRDVRIAPPEPGS